MKVLIIAIRSLLATAAILVLLFWLVAQGSGHNIPDKTNFTFFFTLLTLIVLVGISFLLVKAKKENGES
jgi:hypothetical protein